MSRPRADALRSRERIVTAARERFVEFGPDVFLRYDLRIVQGYSPVRTGFAFLSVIAGTITGSTQIGARLMTRVPPGC